jgi:hypothetical protein
MTDFYSVLKASIIKRGLRSAAARHEVYDQARDAMIRRLWSFDPPLSEEEIDARIGLFDAAAEKIESDLERSLASAETQRRQRPAMRPATPSQPTPPPPVYEGYDEEADYAAVVSRQSPRHPNEVAQQPYSDRGDSTMSRGRRQNAQRETARSSRRDPHDRPAPAAQRRERVDDRWQPAQPRNLDRAESRQQSYAEEPAYPKSARPLNDYETYGESGYEEEVSGEFDRGDRNQLPAVIEYDAADRGNAYESDGYTGTGYRQSPHEEAAYDEPDYKYNDQYADDRYYTANPSHRADVYDARRLPDDLSTADDTAGGLEPTARRRKGKRKPANRVQGKAAKPSRRTGGRSVPILATALGALALILIAFNAYFFLPILFGSDPSGPVTTASPPKIDDRLPALGTPGTASARIVSNSASAVEIPERNLDVTESLVIFNGNDPTVFEGTSNNPIQFDSDSEGGFARISSAASAAGARAVIGPGLADRFAGHTVRVTLLARSSTENGAAKMRFAYQSGLAVSHWQSADLSRNYGTYGIIWRVPAADTAAGDYLLIEPGIPGDGTSADIRMIKIDILAS